MAQNVTIAGASFSDVPALVCPKVGGGTAKFMDTSDANAAAADIAQGKTAYVNGEKVTGTASGGGGASNIVTGTFKGTTTGAAMDVTLNYTGNGYPVAAMFYPTDGIYGNNSFRTLVQRYSCAMFSLSKSYFNTPASYNNTSGADEYVVLNRYKSSSSSSSSYSQSGNTATTTNDTDPKANAAHIIHFRSKTKMSVYIASTSYGFAANIEYTYNIIYSS